jgi:hypothetical protein
MKKLLNIALSLGLLLGVSAHAQYSDPVRPIPANAPKATMVLAGERILNLNGKNFMLAPGGQIMSQKNTSVLTQMLDPAAEYVVRVKFDGQGQVQRVWILTATENEVEAPKLIGEPSFLEKLFSWF